IMVKEVAGWKVCWPEMGINTLGYLQPGKAYLMNTFTGTGTFSYPVCGQLKSIPGFNPRYSPGINPWSDCHETAISHVIALLPEATSNIESGDVLGAFTSSGRCAGYVQLANPAETTLLSIFGDDPLTTDVEGFTESEQILLRLARITTGEVFEIIATWNPGQPQNDGEFSENGISAIDQLKVGAVSVLDNSTDMEIYPNPARDILHIKTTFQGSCNWSLMNIQGILMMLGTFRNQTIIDIASLEPGIYLIKITNKDHVSVTSFVKQ
nr:T9SS type A sorting domain-containing protein [Bacteroidota bacterium]